MAICDHHAPAVMPFAIAGKPIVPVFHSAGRRRGHAVLDEPTISAIPSLVVKPEEGRSLARALGQHPAVMMNRHGATLVGGTIKELVSRSIFMCENAHYQLQALILGTPDRLHHGEVELAGAISRMPNVVTRTWEYWSARVAPPPRVPPEGRVPRRADAARRRSDGDYRGLSRQIEFAPGVGKTPKDGRFEFGALKAPE